ncbi:hypothetical protein [Tanapox virus]|uniref:Uncharacterized protein 127R n=1 Tax=Tanapox virus TaxID=99000 RepID=A7XCR3_9POXV|nr:hypothetical protein [Tanapox virus]ABQ43758.1 hypothetical protein [Tanapox virus]
MNSTFRVIPFFNFSDIKTYVHYLANNGKKNYYGPCHARKITLEIKKHIDDEITVNNLINIHVYKLKTNKKKYYFINDFIISKVIICIQQAKKGGCIIINELNNRKQFKLKDDKIIILSPLSRYYVSKVLKGKLIIIILEMYIPSMQNLLIKNKNVNFANNLKVLYPINGDIIFLIKQISYLNKIICTQILINQQWYCIVNAGSNKLLLPSVCIGKSISLDYNEVHTNIDFVIKNSNIFDNIPFNYIFPQKVIYNNIELNEKVIYCKINHS